MINCGFVDISGAEIYETKTVGKSNLLSRFLLNIYLTDLDRFIFQKAVNFNSSRAFYSFRGSSPLIYKNSVGGFIPIKGHYLLLKKGSNKNLWVDRNKLIFDFNLRRDKDCYFLNYSRRIYYARFLDYFVLALSSSKSFCFDLNRKVNNFVRSSLRFDITVNNVSLLRDNILIFANFSIRLAQKNDGFLSRLRSTKKYLGKIMYRLELYKLKSSKQVASRLNFELLEYCNKVINNTNIFTNGRSMRKVWFFVFQVECIRAMQVGKLLFSNDRVEMFPSEIWNSRRLFFSLTYIRYRFSLYNLKLRVALKKVLKDSISFEGSSLYSMDLYVNVFFEEYKKRLFFIYNDVFLNYSVKSRRKLPLFASSFSTLRGVKLSKRDIYLFDKKSGLFDNGFCVQISKSLDSFEIFAFMPGCLDRLKFEGFFHKFKFRPISNASCLVFEDSFIIKIFGTLAYSFLNWFRCCVNFYSVKILVSFLKESCFLTLSRKHNKTKAWVYTLYSTDLIVLENLVYKKSFFPSSILLRRMKKKFLFSKKSILFDELFFLG